MYNAVIPVAGLGTRSLPASKNIPKEMLPVFDKPAIQLVVEEAVASGAGNVVLVTSRGKSAIEDHFDFSPELESLLERTQKKDFHQAVHAVSRLIDVQTVRQKEQKGLGHAVLTAKNLVTKSPFAVLLGDDLIDAQAPGVGQLIQFYESRLKEKNPNAGVIMLMEVPESEISKYGICEIASDGSNKITRCVEKPKKSETQSRLAIVGRYFLPTTIFGIIESQPKGALGEIQLTDALNTLASRGQLFGHILKGQRFDAGDRIGYLRANIHYYLKDKSLRADVLKLLQEMLNEK